MSFLLTVTLQVFKIRKRGRKIIKIDNKNYSLGYYDSLLLFIRKILIFQEVTSNQRQRTKMVKNTIYLKKVNFVRGVKGDLWHFDHYRDNHYLCF